MNASTSVSRSWRLWLASLLFTSGLCSCQSILPTHVSVVPAEIPMGAPKAWVLWKMGSPQSHEPWYYHPGDLAQVHCHSSLPCGCGPSLLCQKKCRTSQSCKCTSHWEATPIGEVLHYRDDWNDQGRWMDLGSAWADHFATWDVYLDKDDHFVGWRLVDPPGQDRTREQFATMDTSR